MLLIWGASLVAFNLYKSPRKTTNEISPTQFPKQSLAVGFALPRVPKRQERGLDKLKECLTTKNSAKWARKGNHHIEILLSSHGEEKKNLEGLS